MKKTRFSERMEKKNELSHIEKQNRLLEWYSFRTKVDAVGFLISDYVHQQTV